MATTFIYALCDPRTYEVRYVGKSNNPYERYYQHLIEKGKYRKACWIQYLTKNGLFPILQILEQCDEYEWQEKERDWISFEKRCGCNLTNSTIGGEGIIDPTGEIGKKIGESQRGKKFTPEHIRKLKEAWKNRKPASDATNKKISNSLKGRSAWVGKHLAEETKRKISEKLKLNPVKYWLGKHHSAKTKEKISQVQIGKKVTEETKLRMSEAHKKRWADIKNKT